MRLTIGLLGGLGMLLLALSATQAHHAFSGEFDSTKPINLRGKVVRMEWINPHAWLHLAVVGEDGNEEVWMIEAGPPGALVRRGWRKDSVLPGIELVVQGYHAIDGTNKAMGEKLLSQTVVGFLLALQGPAHLSMERTQQNSNSSFVKLIVHSSV